MSGATAGRGLHALTSEGGRDARCTPKRDLLPLSGVLGTPWEPTLLAQPHWRLR